MFDVPWHARAFFEALVIDNLNPGRRTPPGSSSTGGSVLALGANSGIRPAGHNDRNLTMRRLMTTLKGIVLDLLFFAGPR